MLICHCLSGLYYNLLIYKYDVYEKLLLTHNVIQADGKLKDFCTPDQRYINRLIALTGVQNYDVFIPGNKNMCLLTFYLVQLVIVNSQSLQTVAAAQCM